MFTLPTSQRLFHSTYDFYKNNTEKRLQAADRIVEVNPSWAREYEAQIDEQPMPVQASESRDSSSIMPFVHRHVTARARNFGVALASPVTGAVDLALGSLAVVGSVFSGGKVQTLNDFAYKNTFEGGLLLSRTYQGLVRTVNPHAKFKTNHTFGLFSTAFGEKILRLANGFAYGDTAIQRQVLSRITYVGFILFSIVARIVDFVIGLVATIASLVTAGKFKIVNEFAFNGLSVTLVVNDIYVGLVKCVNPLTDLPALRYGRREDYVRSERESMEASVRVSSPSYSQMQYIPQGQPVAVSVH